MKFTEVTLRGAVYHYINEETGQFFYSKDDLPEGAIIEKKDLEHMICDCGQHCEQPDEQPEIEPISPEDQALLMEDPCPPGSEMWESMMKGMKNLKGPLD